LIDEERGELEELEESESESEFELDEDDGELLLEVEDSESDAEPLLDVDEDFTDLVARGTLSTAGLILRRLHGEPPVGT
jgi:hypothetical protein